MDMKAIFGALLFLLILWLTAAYGQESQENSGSVEVGTTSSSSSSAEVRSQESKLSVAVYYETLCGDSKKFIRSQLYPVKKSSLGEHFDVELVPYGKATTTPSSNSWTFKCQHGNAECRGNAMHACSLQYINSTETQLEFIYCSMSTRNPPLSLDECSEKLKIDPTEIRKCAEGPEGAKLLAQNGEKTHALKPTLHFVPWVTYDGEFTEENLVNSQSSFKTVVCNELRKNGVSSGEVVECEATVEKWGARRA